MPLYEYRCEQCDKVFELIQRFSDEPLRIHEGCGGRVERLISVSALQFKGSGWYVNDYGRGGQNGAPKEGSQANGGEKGKPAEKSGSGSSSEGKAESKSEKKSEKQAESKPADSAKPASTARK
jgi:putative FmdB family regulatory protein